MTKEQASELYIKGKLRDSNDYLGCEESRRMTLIQSDMYTVQQAFEDGAVWAGQTMIKKTCDYLYKLNQMNLKEHGRLCPLVDIAEFRKVMEE